MNTFKSFLVMSALGCGSGSRKIMKLLPLFLAFASASVAGAQVPAQPISTGKEVFPANPLQPDLTPGYVLIEGDIQIPLSQFNTWTEQGPRPQATAFGGALWPDSVVPYDFVTTGNGAVSPANQTAAINAMAAISVRAGVNFRPALSTDSNWIRFQNSQVNNSPVGMQTGMQIINIVSWTSQIRICHEIYHSLGFYHEQGRPDRGNYVTINYANICGAVICPPGLGPGQCCSCQDMNQNCISCAFNFNIQNSASTYGPYDFDSFMHYGRSDFSCNGLDTITVNSPYNAQWQNAIGQRDHFSYYDALDCRALYPFTDDRWLDSNFTGPPLGVFQFPYNDATLDGALAKVPSGGTLFIKYGNTYTAINTYNTPVTIAAPDGDVILGN